MGIPRLNEILKGNGNLQNLLVDKPLDVNLLLAKQLGVSPSLIREVFRLEIEDRFVNPTTDNPIKAHKFLKHLDLSKIAPILEKMYEGDYRFKYPPEAVLKTMIYFKLKRRFLSEVFNDLVTDPELAENLGFYMIPDYKQLYHFLNYRLGGDGTKMLSDAFVIAIRKEFAKLNLAFGERLVIDATPLEAKPTDKDAQYNGHYKIKGYLWHNLRDLDTGIPIAFHITHANEDEGNFLAPLLMKARQLGIKFREVYFDCGYASLENIMRVEEFFEAKVYCNIADNWKVRKDGFPEEIKKQYTKLWMEPFWKPKVSFGYMKYALMLVDKTKNIGAYHRNRIMAEYEECPDGYLESYYQRNRIEGNHGTEKRQTEIKNFNGKGIDKFTAHVGLHVITMQAMALCRLQNGVTEGLINLGGLT